jgi:hypothetical protein
MRSAIAACAPVSARAVVRAAVLLAVLAVPAISVAQAAEKAPASGTFTSKNISFTVRGGYAYPSLSSLGKEPIVNVAVSNDEITSSVIDPFIDRKKAIDKYVADDRTAVINFEFTPAGKFDGVSYYLGSGNGCGYCSGPEMKSTVKLTAGRLVGQLTYKTKDVSWNIALDVPVASTDHGAALPAGGGEPGKAYQAYATAVRARNAAAVKKLMPEWRVNRMAKAEKDGQLNDYLDFLADEHGMASVKIDKGFATADTAVLVVTGKPRETGGSERKGEVILTKEAGTWRVAFENVAPDI